MFTVLPLIAMMWVPGRILAPEIVCPTAKLPVEDTEVMLVLPLVTTPVIGLTTIRVSAVPLLLVAGADKVSVLPLIPVMVVPAGIKLPIMVCPTANPVVDDTEVTLVLPLVTIPVGKGLETAAGGARVMAEVLALIEPTRVPAGMLNWETEVPTAVIGCPTATPARLVIPVMTLLFAVIVPMGESAPALAAFDIVMVPVLGLSAVMVVPGATPTGAPTRASAVALPVAALDNTNVLPLIDVMVVPEGMKLPVTIPPTANPTVEDTAVTLVLPVATVPVNGMASGCPTTSPVKPALGTL